MGEKLTFEHPWYWLAVLPLAALFWWVANRSKAPLARDQIRQSLILRITAIVLIVGAIAAPLLIRDTQDQTVVYLVDVSRSISPAARAREFALVRSSIDAKPARDSAGVIAFASAPVVLASPSTTPQMPGDAVPVDDSSTDLAAAIRAARAIMPASGPRQIVILSDGNENSGSALSEASTGGIAISAVDPDSFLGIAQPEASVVRVDLPPTCRDGAPVMASVVVASSVEQKATLTATVDGKVTRTQSANLGIGKTLVEMPIKLVGAGLRQVKVDLNAPNDTLLENNTGTAMTRVLGKPRILYLTDAPDQVAPTLQRAMQLQSISLDLRSPLQAPRDVAGFSAYDSVVLSNITSTELSAAQQQALQSSVEDFGVGLGMVGGTQSFIGGGWAGTPVEASLPVLMKPRAGTKMPGADIVIVLDQSNSMSAEENGVEKVKLAALAAVSLMGSLQPQDRVAVIAVTETPTIVVPFSSPKDAIAAKKDVEGLEAGGGGIYCLVGLEAAYNMLETSHAAIKHVIICPDTTDSEQQDNCVNLAQQMRLHEKITTSCCGIGDWHDSDVGFQKDLAQAGGGQLYVVNQATDLPTFFTRDLSHFQTPSFLEGAFRASIDSSDRVVAGLSAAAEPPLLGYNVVTLRPGAFAPLRNVSRPDPILAYRSYGLGRSFAFMSDETDHWAKNWLKWPGYGQMWSQVLRWSLRQSKAADFQAFVAADNDGQGHLIVDAFAPDGSYVNGANFAATIARPNASISSLELSQTAPGRYETNFAARDLGAYLVSVRRSGASDQQAILGLAQSYPAEYAQSAPNLPLLASLALESGGRMIADSRDVWKLRPGAAQSNIALEWLFLLLSAVVFIADIAWRRLGLRLQAKRAIRPITVAVTSATTLTIHAVHSAREQRAAAQLSSERRSQNVDTVAESAVLTRTVSRHMPAENDDNSFPLVASLDDLRRRERAKDADDQNRRN